MSPLFIRHAKLHEMGGLRGIITTFLSFLLQNHRYMSSDWVVWSRHQVVHCQPINLVGATGNRNIHSPVGSSGPPHPWNWLVSCSSLNLFHSSRELLKDCTVWHGAIHQNLLLEQGSFYRNGQPLSGELGPQNIPKPYTSHIFTSLGAKMLEMFHSKTQMWLRIW